MSSQDGPKGFQKFPVGLNRLSWITAMGPGHPWPLSRAVGCWVTAVAPTVKTIPAQAMSRDFGNRGFPKLSGSRDVGFPRALVQITGESR